MINLGLDISKKEAIVLTDNVIKTLSLVLFLHLFAYAEGDEDLFNDKTVRKFLYTVVAMIIYSLMIRPIFIKRMKISKKKKMDEKKTSEEENVTKN
jgi:hypothetical protein